MFGDLEKRRAWVAIARLADTSRLHHVAIPHRKGQLGPVEKRDE